MRAGSWKYLFLAQLLCAFGAAVLPTRARSVDMVLASPAPDFQTLFSAEANIVNRVRIVNRLGDTLTKAQIQQLFKFVAAVPGEEEENAAGVQFLKNEILNVLRSQSVAPAGLTEVMIEIYQNKKQDFVMRDYAIQHLGWWFEDGAADAPDAKRRIIAVLSAAAKETSSIGGTALLALHHASQIDESVDASAVDQLALQDTMVEGISDATRATAIQICAERKLTKALPAIQTAAEQTHSTAVRLSAIAGLGALGGEEQIPLLKRLQSQPSTQVACQNAIKQIQQKTQKTRLF